MGLTIMALKGLDLNGLLSRAPEPTRDCVKALYNGCKNPSSVKYAPFNKGELLKKYSDLPALREPVPGDMVYDESSDSDYGYNLKGYSIRIPAPKDITEFLERFRAYADGVHGMKRVFSAVEFTELNVPQIGTGMSKAGHVFDKHRFSDAVSVLFDGKTFDLADFMAGNIGAICFSSALSLYVLIKNDEELSRGAFKPYLGTGIYGDEEGGLHAWVNLHVNPSGRDGNFKYEDYVLDSALNMVGVYENSIRTACPGDPTSVVRIDNDCIPRWSELYSYKELENWHEYNNGSRKIVLRTGILRPKSACL